MLLLPPLQQSTHSGHDKSSTKYLRCLSSNKTEIYVVKPTEEKEIKSSQMTKSQFLVGSLETELFIP